MWRDPETAAKALGFFIVQAIGGLELRRSSEFGVPEQEQSGAETLFSRQLGSDGFSVNTDVPEEEKEEARGVNKTSAGAPLTV